MEDLMAKKNKFSKESTETPLVNIEEENSEVDQTVIAGTVEVTKSNVVVKPFRFKDLPRPTKLPRFN
jgi:hypothetical protein